jgi:uncharacterized membrane protein YidH (DUF202 family)
LKDAALSAKKERGASKGRAAMFEGWDSFYLLVGGGAGAFISTMFVVATLMGDLEQRRLDDGRQVFITPVVFHFGVVFVVSVLTAVPHLTRGTLGLLLALGSAAGLGYAVTTLMRLRKLDWEGFYNPDLSDTFFYGVAPIVVYLAMGAAAWDVWFDAEDAPYLIGWLMLVLVSMGIRNAWDLATALVQRKQESNANDKQKSETPS